MNSRQTLENIVNTIADPIFVKDRQHRFVLLNNACCELIGHPREKLIGKSDYDFFPKEEADVFWEKDEIVFKTGKENLNEEKITDCHGVEHTIVTKKRLFKDGKNTYIVGVIRDMTEFKKVEKDLRETEEMYRQILDAIADMVLCKGPHSKIIWANKAFRDYYGMTNEQLKDIIDAPFNVPDYTKQYVRDDSYVFSTGKNLNIPEEPVTRFDGVVRFFHTVKSAIFDSQGHVKMTVGVSRDVTEKKKSDETLIKQAVDLAISQAEKEQLELFAYVAAHDLREPLQRIIGFSDLIFSKYASKMDEEQKNYVSKIQNSSLRLSQIIDDLLKFAKVVDKKEFFHTVDLKNIVSDVLIDLEFLIQRTSAKVDVDFLPEVFGDEGQLRQLFHNLTSNAIKFAKEGQTPKVRIYSNPSPANFWEIIVEDEGIGLDMAHSEKIFKPFERLDHSGKYTGSGVGLAICHKIVNHHGGRISVSSKIGVGSKFYIYLCKSSVK